MNLITAGNTHRPPTLRNMPLEATLLATPSPFQYKPSPNIFSRFFSSIPPGGGIWPFSPPRRVRN